MNRHIRKTRFIVLLGVLLALILPAAQADQPVRAAAFTGPTGMGMAPLMQADREVTSLNDYEFMLASSPDQIVPLLVRGELDIACVPANLAAVLWNNTQGKVRVLAVNTLGVLYIASHGQTLSGTQDLKGRTVYASGKGSTPEYALRYVLDHSSLTDNDVNVEWKSEHAEALAAFLKDPDSLVLLPQPFITVAAGKCEDLVIAIDLNEAWESIPSGDGASPVLITGCVIARTDFISENPRQVENFLTEYASAVEYVNTDIPGAAAVIGSEGIFDASVAEKAIPFCHIVCVTGAQMRDMLTGYFSVLYDYDSAGVGGALPDDGLYYVSD